jgi:hypothetical protein
VAKLRATGFGNKPSPLRRSQTAAYSNQDFNAWSCPREFSAGRQYARGASLEDSGSMLDSAFRERNKRRHC